MRVYIKRGLSASLPRKLTQISPSIQGCDGAPNSRKKMTMLTEVRMAFLETAQRAPAVVEETIVTFSSSWNADLQFQAMVAVQESATDHKTPQRASAP